MIAIQNLKSAAVDGRTWRGGSIGFAAAPAVMYLVHMALALVFAMTPSVASSQTGEVAFIWVDTNGGSCVRNSSPQPYNDGTACGSLDAANDVARNGDTIIVRGGTYGAQSINGGNGRTSRAIVTVAAGETMTMTGTLELEGARFLTIDGGGGRFGVGARLVLAAMGSANSFTPTNQHTTTISQSDDVTIQGADFGGWQIMDSTNVTYRNNDIGPCNSWDRAEGGGQGCDNGSIEYCEAQEIGCRGYNTGHLVEGNNIHDFGCDDSFYNGVGSDDCHWECMYVSYAHNLTVRGNKFTNCANGGNIFHTFSNGGGTFTADFGFVNYTLENNIFEQSCNNNLGGGSYSPCGGRLDAASGFGHCNIYGGTDMTNVVIRFNTFLGGSGFDMSTACTVGSPGVMFIGNMRNGSTVACAGSWPVKPVFQYEIYHTYGGICTGTGNRNVGDLANLVLNDSNGPNKDARLLGTSTAADNLVPSTVTGGCPGLDIFGVSRPGDPGMCDAGAHERGGTGSGTPSPPTNLRIVPSTAMILPESRWRFV